MENVKEFAIAFVISVTVVSDEPGNWIAKNGKDSIFATLREIFPEVRLVEIESKPDSMARFQYLNLESFGVDFQKKRDNSRD